MSIIYINPYRFGPAYDADAQDYFNRVIAADVAAGNTSGLEVDVQNAINDFVVGCKSDGIWNAIKASCILAGARTLAGALVPLVGTAPTNNNFVAGDYDRETGLKGNGSTKYLGSNRAGNADPLNSAHLSVFASTASTSGAFKTYISAGTGVGPYKGLAYDTSASLGTYGTLNSNTVIGSTGTQLAGFIGISRPSSATVDFRAGGSTSSTSNASTSAPTLPINIFATSSATNFADGRLAFYSIGESLDLALLDTRVTTLMSDLAAAIP